MNEFRDRTTGIIFNIVAPRQLTEPEADAIAKIWCAKELDFLFDSWKSFPPNQNWTGDEKAKKEELFKQTYLDPEAKPRVCLFLVVPDEEHSDDSSQK